MSSVSNGSHGLGSSGGYGSHNVVALQTPKTVDPLDAQMDQIRDLLFGELKREIDERFAAIESRLMDFERRLSAARSELSTARTEDEGKRKAMLDDIARGVEALGQHVKQLSR